jgi:hypothetical protein
VTAARRTRSRLLTAALALALAAGLSGSLAAQTAAIAATASVSTTALSVLALTNTRFGNVTPGTPVTINPQTSANAGEFEFHGNRNAQFHADFTLPTQLTTGPGGWTMPITFANNSACRRNTAVQGGCTRFNPHNPLVQRLRNQNPPNDTYFVWIGGTVTPAAGQHTGVYKGTITITAYYTGL